MFHQFYIPKGKITYFVNGLKFQSDKNTKNGYEKATSYCLNNFIDSKLIIKFDSELECDRYIYLLEQQKIDNISNLTHHYNLLVQPSFINSNGDTIPAITYCADFVYFDKRTNKRVVEDVKGYSLISDTRFEIEKELFDHNFKDKDLYIKVIILRNKEWIEWKIGEPKTKSKLIKKQSQTIREQKKVLHSQLVQDNKKTRQIARYKELKALEHLTTTQKKRLNELHEILVDKGVIID